MTKIVPDNLMYAKVIQKVHVRTALTASVDLSDILAEEARAAPLAAAAPAGRMGAQWREAGWGVGRGGKRWARGQRAPG